MWLLVEHNKMSKIEIEINDGGIVESLKINDERIYGVQKFSLDISCFDSNITFNIIDKGLYKFCSNDLSDSLSHSRKIIESLPFAKITELNISSVKFNSKEQV